LNRRGESSFRSLDDKLIQTKGGLSLMGHDDIAVIAVSAVHALVIAKDVLGAIICSKTCGISI
jgi:hypothetical protein